MYFKKIFFKNTLFSVFNNNNNNNNKKSFFHLMLSWLPIKVKEERKITRELNPHNPGIEVGG